MCTWCDSDVSATRQPNVIRHSKLRENEHNHAGLPQTRARMLHISLTTKRYIGINEMGGGASRRRTTDMYAIRIYYTKEHIYYCVVGIQPKHICTQRITTHTYRHSIAIVDESIHLFHWLVHMYMYTQSMYYIYFRIFALEYCNVAMISGTVSVPSFLIVCVTASLLLLQFLQINFCTCIETAIPYEEEMPHY